MSGDSKSSKSILTVITYISICASFELDELTEFPEDREGELHSYRDDAELHKFHEVINLSTYVNLCILVTLPHKVINQSFRFVGIRNDHCRLKSNLDEPFLVFSIYSCSIFGLKSLVEVLTSSEIR